MSKRNWAIVLFSIPILGQVVQAIRFWQRGDTVGGIISIILFIVLSITVWQLIIKKIDQNK